MNTFNFASTPVIGNIMSATGISDGWIVVCCIVALLAIIFLIAWIRSAAKGRAARKQLAALQQEIVGLRALTTLPPLHEGDWSYDQDDDTGGSLVFASAKELKQRQQATANAASQNAPQQSTVAASSLKADQGVQETHNAAAERAATADNAGNVTAQVHEAIFASVTGGHLKNTGAKSASGKKPLSASDVPSLDSKGASKKRAAKKGSSKADAGGDASLSSRIPKL